MWSQMKKSHVNVVSNEQVSKVVVSNERSLKLSGRKCMASSELVSIVCTPCRAPDEKVPYSVKGIVYSSK